MKDIHNKLFLIFIICLCIIGFYTLPDYGITWDEPLYYQAGDSYIQWDLNFLQGLIKCDLHSSLSSDQLDLYWEKNAQHPPLVKISTGISKLLFGFMKNKTSTYRLSELFWYLVLVSLVFYITRDISSSTASWFAAVATASMPRLFAHAHFVELDLPLSVFWLLTIYCFYIGLEKNTWSNLTGISFGLALLTKVTAIFILIPLLLWAQFIIKKKYTNNLFSMVFIGVPLFIFLWPWLWHNSFARIVDYYHLFLTFKSPLKTFYWGHAYSSTPWHYPWYMMMVTTPLTILILFIWAALKSIRNTQTFSTSISLLFLINILFLLVLFSLPGTLVIDGTRYFLPIFPIIGILSGIGFHSLTEKIKPTLINRKYLVSFLFVVCLLPSLFWLVYLHPYQLSYFNLLIGGPMGAQKAGMETTYWGEVIGPKEISWMNQNFPQNAKIKILPVYPGNAPMAALSFYPDVVVYSQNIGYFRKDLQFFAEPPYDYFILVSRQGLFDEVCWRLYKSETPIYFVKRNNIQLVGIYKTANLR